jgi:hypothetical protein
MITRVLNQAPLVLAPGQAFQTAAWTLDPQTASLHLRIRRPTTGDLTTVWDETTTLRVSIDVSLDGVRYRATGESTGGIRARGLVEPEAYGLRFHLPYGFFGGLTSRRLGESRAGTLTAHCTVEVLRGLAVSTQLLFVEVEASPAPAASVHQSVTFDTASAAEEEFGDRVLSLTHTAGGSTNRAVFAGATFFNSAAIVHSTSLTYGGTSMVEQWDVFDDVTTALGNAGYSLAIGATLTGAQTVTSTIGAGGTIVYHTLAVVSLTDVDQTTPVGTPQFSAENTADTTSPVELTVTGVGADDLVLDQICAISTGAPAVGADQTATLNHNDAGTTFMAVSRQLGSAGGVMGWTVTGLTGAMSGAIAFKPSAAGGIAIPVLTRQYRERWT